MTVGFRVERVDIALHGAAPSPLTRVLKVVLPNVDIDAQYGGGGTIVGTVRKVANPMNLPLKRRVRLHDELSGRLLQETVSSQIDGSYTFTGLKLGINYTLISYDSDHDFRAVIADRIQAS